MAREKSVTIKDIAARVGVSNMTVSAVLSQTRSAHVRVSEGTRVRVLDVARAMNYRPNRAARSLRSQSTDVIGIYSAHGYLNPAVALTSQLLGGLHQGCDACQKDLLLHSSYRNHSPEEILAELADGRVDGLVLYTASTDPLAAHLAQSSLPVIAVVDALPGLPSVVADDASGGRLLAEHLAARGHRRIFYRAGDVSLVSAARRQAGFLEAAQEHDMTVTVQGPSLGGDLHEVLTEADVAWLDRPREERPTAAVCWNDLTAYNLLNHCRARGLSLPDDLAVAGYDDIPPPASDNDPRPLGGSRAYRRRCAGAQPGRRRHSV
jgi:DNA-binding LacI/PurR family transcriptional regulator